MTDVVENVVVTNSEVDNNDLVDAGESELLDTNNLENAQNNSIDEDLCFVLDSTTNNETDILELSEKEVDAEIEKSIDSDEGDESPVERGKFVSERVIETTTEGMKNDGAKDQSKFNRFQGAKRKLNQGFKRNSHFNNRKMMNNDLRPRFSQQNRFRYNQEIPRNRMNPNFIQQQPMNNNMPFQQMQQVNPNVPIFANNTNFPNVTNIQPYPVQQQLIINQTPAFQNPYIISQIQIPQQIPNVQSIITNQPNYSFTQFPVAINGVNVNQGYAFQQPNIPAPMPASNFNLAVATGNNVNNTETRKVLINPHFKGRINVQEGRLDYERSRNIDDNELLRQQEEFINQNRRNLQKRMQQPKYSDRDSPDSDYRHPPKSRYSYTAPYHRRSPDSRHESNLLKKSPATAEAVVEDKETLEYRKRVEDQRKKRELFLKQKEERRRQRMQVDDVDSTVKEPLEKPNDLHLNETKFKEESIHNRLNKPVHRTGVLNLRTGLIKPKSKCADSSSSNSNVKIETSSSVVSDNENATPQPAKTTTVVTKSEKEDTKNASSKSIEDNELDDVLLQDDKSVIPKAGFLGRRLVISSNLSKHNIVVQAENKEPEIKVENKSVGIFSNVVVNQEFSDDEDLSFLD